MDYDLILRNARLATLSDDEGLGIVEQGAIGIKAGKCLIGRSVIEAEELHHLRGWKRIAEWIEAPDQVKIR